jgi:hypothetical protein
LFMIFPPFPSPRPESLGLMQRPESSRPRHPFKHQAKLNRPVQSKTRQILGPKPSIVVSNLRPISSIYLISSDLCTKLYASQDHVIQCLLAGAVQDTTRRSTSPITVRITRPITPHSKQPRKSAIAFVSHRHAFGDRHPSHARVTAASVQVASIHRSSTLGGSRSAHPRHLTIRNANVTAPRRQTGRDHTPHFFSL